MRGIEFAITFVWVFSNLLSFAIIGRIIMSWVTMGNVGGGGWVTRILHDVTEPAIRLARKLPHRVGMMDFAPMIALIGIDLTTRVLIILIQQIPIQ